MKPLRFRLLQARAPDDLVKEEERASFVELLEVDSAHVQSWDLLQGHTSPERVTQGVDAVLVGGSGAYGVNDDVAWMRSFIDTLGSLADTGSPLFASCFGFQGLCVALGATVISDPDGAEVGTYSLNLTDAGKTDPLFRSLPHRFLAQEGHKDRAIGMPKGCTWLARSDRCPYQAIRVGEGLVYATQFHPELDDQTQRLRFSRYFDLYKGIYGEARAREILEEMRPSPEANALLAGFAQQVRAVRDGS